MVNPAIQIGLEIGAHGAVHGTWKDAEYHPIGVMNPPPWQLKAAPQGHRFKGIFDDFDHLIHRQDLIDRRVFEEEHAVQSKQVSRNTVGALSAALPEINAALSHRQPQGIRHEMERGNPSLHVASGSAGLSHRWTYFDI